MGDGNGWAYCAAGHLHWGRHGAAGLLAYHLAPDGEVRVLLQQRAWWTPGGRTWGLLGGASDSDEDAVATALREAAEESTAEPGDFRVHGVLGSDHGGWSYDTVIASTDRLLPVGPASMETKDVAWVRVDEVGDRALFPPFAAAWPDLEEALVHLIIVVDAANVVGARADGWWRDRAGATARLRDELTELSARGLTDLPEGVDGPALDLWFPEIVLVVEGAARAIVPGQPGYAAHAEKAARAAGTPARAAEETARAGRTGDDESRGPVTGPRGAGNGPGVRVVAAPGSGDDTIAELAGASPPDARTLVVTADRELRERCRRAGAAVTGPRWLLSRLAAP